MLNTLKTWKRRAGAVALDLPGFLARVSRPAEDRRTAEWVGICNRRERLLPNPNGPGVACDWEFTSELTLCNEFPTLGTRLMSRALSDWEIAFASAIPETTVPAVSFVIPHRGRERAPLLRATVESIAAQRGIGVECLVVEQSAEPELSPEDLPANTRLIRLPHPNDPDDWHKSWAYNEGVRAAQGEIVVCHDGDILAPVDYAAELVARMQAESLQAVFLQRFLFYLTQDATQAVLANRCFDRLPPPENVKQNWKGGTAAIRRDAYFEIGGFDESFTGWSGEDLDFFDRCHVLRCHHYGYIPFVHLWHPPQPGKFSAERDQNIDFTVQRRSIPAADRVRELRARTHA